jgi:3-phenylpropionate/cinnamic acid dioxygenase small subunit
MTGSEIAFDLALRERIGAFYAYEVALLDDCRFREWLELLDHDIRYVMPMREITAEPDPDEFDERLPRYFLLDEDRASLEMRVARIETGLSLTDTPPSAVQRFVTNVLVTGQTEDCVEVRSGILVFHVRDERNEVHYAGRRTDRLRKVGAKLRLLRREIKLVAHVLPKSISIFF